MMERDGTLGILVSTNFLIISVSQENEHRLRMVAII